MRGKLIDLVSALRFEGVPVALTEAIEAAELLASGPTPSAATKETIRLMLLPCLVKDSRYLTVFHEQFERWWARWYADLDLDLSLEEIAESVRSAIYRGDREHAEKMIQIAVSFMRQNMQGDGLVDPRSPLARPTMNRELYDQLRDALRLDQLNLNISGDMQMGQWHRQSALNTLNKTEAALRKIVFHDSTSAIKTVQRIMDLAEDDIADISISKATYTQLQKMQEMVPEIVRQLSHRRRYQESSRSGTLLFRKTMRSSLSNGGVPLELTFRRKAPKRERIAVLCDLSGSVERFSMFTLQLANCFSTQFAGVRCYGFISNIDDITRFVSRSDFPYSLKGMYSEANLVMGTPNSHYGQVFQEFVRKFMGDLGRNTAVLILGDARNNSQDPGLEAFRTLRSWVKEIHWLNPEPKESWAFGDSVMYQYMEMCDSAHHIRSVSDLARFMASLRDRRVG